MPIQVPKLTRLARFALLIGLAVLVIFIVAIVRGKISIDKLWIWAIGLAGPIIAFAQNIFGKLSDLLGKVEGLKTNKIPDATKQKIISYKTQVDNLKGHIDILEKRLKHEGAVTDEFKGTTLTVLRYFSDGDTSLGLFFFEADFFSYTLEDAYHQVKVPGKTRIPQGIYKLDFHRENTPLTIRYRETRPWFNYHLELKEVNGFSGIYIHTGSSHEDTEGCLLIADNILSSDTERTIFNSKKTFERFYLKVKTLIDSGQSIRIRVYDEVWYKQLVLKQKLL